MKKIFLFSLTAALFFILAGCAGSPSPASEENGSAVKTATAEEKKPEIRKITVPVLLSETKYQRTGHVDTKIINTVDKDSGKLLSSVTYDSAGEIFETVTVEYSGNTAVYYYHDREKNLLKTRKTVTDKNGNITESVLLDYAGKQISKSVYKYRENTGEKTRWEIFDSADLLLGYNEYIYENGLNVKSNSFSPSGSLEEYFIYSYSNTGDMISADRFNKNNTRLSGTVYEYRNSLPVSEKIFRGEKSLLNDIVYEYSEKDGQRFEKKTIKAPDGSVVEISEKIYLLLEKEITLN